MTGLQFFALAPLIVIAATAVIAMLSIAVKRHFALISGIAAGGMLIALWMSVRIAPSVRAAAVQVTGLLRIDAAAGFAMALMLFAGLAVSGFCHAYFKAREGENEELFLLLLTALLGSLVLVCSSHFASFFIGLETLSVALFALIAYPLQQTRALEAAIKYLLLSGVASASLLMGMALIYAQCGALDFAGIGACISATPEISIMILGGSILLLAGVGFKLSLIPFHMWTPDVYEGAPAPIGAFIATVSKGAVFIVLLRFFLGTGLYAYQPLMNVLSIMAALSILGGNLLALLQHNVKRVLAYSSIAHMGYMLAAFIAGRTIAPALLIEALGFYLVAYFITTLGAFGVVSLLSTPQQEAGDLLLYLGLFRRHPWLAAVFTLMLLSLAGIPLTAGFIGKFYIFLAAADARLWALLSIVIIGSGLGLYYYLRIIVMMSLNSEEAGCEGSDYAPEWLAAATLAVLALLLVGFGVYPGPLVGFMQSMAATFR